MVVVVECPTRLAQSLNRSRSRSTRKIPLTRGPKSRPGRRTRRSLVVRGFHVGPFHIPVCLPALRRLT